MQNRAADSNITCIQEVQTQVGSLREIDCVHKQLAGDEGRHSCPCLESSPCMRCAPTRMDEAQLTHEGHYNVFGKARSRASCQEPLPLQKLET
eukprot:428564-Amphidinium_carterae.1